MFYSIIIISIIFLYCLLMVWGAAAIEKNAKFRHFIYNPVTYALSLTIFTTVWSYYGNIGSAARSGIFSLSIFLGMILITLFGFPIIKRLVRLKNENRSTSIADFISSRYGKSIAIAAIITVMIIVGLIPYIGLQLKAVFDNFTLISGSGNGWMQLSFEILILSMLALSAIYTGLRRVDPTEGHPGLIGVVAASSIIKIVVTIVSGMVIIYTVFGSPGEFFTQISKSQSYELIPAGNSGAASLSRWISFVILAMLAFLSLPRQFHIAVVENKNTEHINSSKWIFLLVTILLHLFILPVAFAGIYSGYPVSEGDNFLLLIPLRHGQNWLAALVYIGGFATAISMIMVSLLTVSTMLANHVVQPLAHKFVPLGFLKGRVREIKIFFIILFLLSAFLFNKYLSLAYSLTNIGIMSFLAVAQLAPAYLIGIFWKKGNKKGALASLAIGFLLWLFLVIVPVLVRGNFLPDSILSEGLFGISILKPENLFDLNFFDPVSNALFWSLFFNTAVYLYVSIHSKQTDEESEMAVNFLVSSTDSIEMRAAGIELENTVDLVKKMDVVRALLNNYYEEEETGEILNNALNYCRISGKEKITIVEHASFTADIERRLAGTIGAGIARKAVKEAGIFTAGEINELSNYYASVIAEMNLTPGDLMKKINFYQERERLLLQNAAELKKIIGELENEIKTRKEVEEALKESQQEIRDFYDNANVGVYRTDVEGNVIMANPAMITLLGFNSLEEMKQSPAYENYKNPEDRQRLLDALMENSFVQSFEAVVLKRDGSEMTISFSARAIRDSAGRFKYLEGIALDVTQKKLAEKAILAAMEEAEKSNNLKSEFLAQMSHEIRTPINAILSFSSLIKEEIKSSATEEINESFSVIEYAGERLIRTIDLILRMSEIQTGNLEVEKTEFDLEAGVMKMLCSEYKRKAAVKGLSLHYRNDAGRVILINDRNLILGIFDNLINNSVKYTDEGSIEIILKYVDEYPAVTVKDTGIGISQEFLVDLFKPFRQEEQGYTRSYEGNGLGLALVNKYAEIVNAEISVESEKNKGTAITVVFKGD